MGIPSASGQASCKPSQLFRDKVITFYYVHEPELDHSLIMNKAKITKEFFVGN
jgi:hypothetical protein